MRRAMLGRKEKDTGKGINGENAGKLEITEVALSRFNVVNNNYQQTSKVFFTLALEKRLEQLINISPHRLTMLQAYNLEFSFIEIWFTDQNSKPLEIKDKVYMTFIVG